MLNGIIKPIDSLTLFNTMVRAVDVTPMALENKVRVNDWINRNGPQLLKATALGARIATRTTYNHIKDKAIKMIAGGTVGTAGGGVFGYYFGSQVGHSAAALMLLATQIESVSTATGIASGLAAGAIITSLGTLAGIRLGYNLSNSLLETVSEVLLEVIETGLLEESLKSE